MGVCGLTSTLEQNRFRTSESYICTFQPCKLDKCQVQQYTTKNNVEKPGLVIR